MLRLTLLLCAAMVGALMLLGEDRGQKRPGLVNATANAPAPMITPKEEAPPVLAAASPTAAALAAPVAAPVPAIEPAPAPYVEPVREVVQAVEEPVFTLSAFGNEPVPGEDGAAVATDQPTAAPAEGIWEGIWYVNASSVNVRAQPSTDAQVLGRLTNGEAALMVAAVDDDWARIVIQGDGLEGFVALRYLSPEAP